MPGKTLPRRIGQPAVALPYQVNLATDALAHPKCALACTRVGWLGPHLQRLRRLRRYALRHLRDRSPVRRVWRQHTKVAMRVRARGRNVPQLCVKGEFIGSSDIMMELYESSELQQVINGQA